MLRHQLANAINTERMEEERKALLKRVTELLNTPVGKELVDELEAVWSPPELFKHDPYATAYAVGQRDAYQFLRDLQNQYRADAQ